MGYFFQPATLRGNQSVEYCTRQIALFFLLCGRSSHRNYLLCNSTCTLFCTSFLALKPFILCMAAFKINCRGLKCQNISSARLCSEYTLIKIHNKVLVKSKLLDNQPLIIVLFENVRNIDTRTKTILFKSLTCLFF